MTTPPRYMILLVLGSLCFLALLKIFYQLWWAPIRLQKLLGLRGIRGPNYRFIHGSSKEIKAMQKEAVQRPMDLSDHNIFAMLQPHIHHWTNLYGKNYLQWDGIQAEVVVSEPELVKEILSNKDGLYCKEKTKPFVKRLLGNGILTSQGEKWAKVRKLANHAFHGESLKRMIPNIIESTEIMLESWKYKEGKEVEVYEEFRCFTAEVISKTAFGSNYMEGRKIFELLMKLSILMGQSFYKQSIPGISKIFKTGDEIEAERLEKEVRESIVELIRKREKSGDKDRDYESDFLGSLVKAHHDDNHSQRISVDDVVDECKNFYFAGQETTNSLLAWTMLLLATHVDWQEKARKEVIDLLGKQSPKPDDLAKLKIMNMIINECLRLYPPAISLIRQVKRVVKLGNFKLPAHVKVLISILSIHNDPGVWGQEAHQFKPERFSEGVATATKNNIAAFLPFGLGPRACVGFNFAIVEAKIALVMILQRYAFTLSPGYVHSPTQVLTTRPQYGVQVILQSL